MAGAMGCPSCEEGAMTYFNDAFKLEFESGSASTDKMIQAMAELVRERMHWSVRGYYRRLAQTMIDGGWISDAGEIL